MTDANPVLPGVVFGKTNGFGLATTAVLPVPLTAIKSGLPDGPVYAIWRLFVFAPAVVGAKDTCTRQEKLTERV